MPSKKQRAKAAAAAAAKAKTVAKQPPECTTIAQSHVLSLRARTRAVNRQVRHRAPQGASGYGAKLGRSREHLVTTNKHVVYRKNRDKLQRQLAERKTTEQAKPETATGSDSDDDDVPGEIILFKPVAV